MRSSTKIYNTDDINKLISKLVGINLKYRELVHPRTSSMGCNKAFKEYVENLLKLSQFNYLSDSICASLEKPFTYNELKLSSAREKAVAYLNLANAGIKNPKPYIDLINSLENPEKVSAAIVQLHFCNRLDLVSWCCELNEADIQAFVIRQLTEKNLLTDKILTKIKRFSNESDDLNSIILKCVAGGFLTEKKLDLLLSHSSKYLHQIRWLMATVDNFAYDPRAKDIFEWFFPLNSMWTIPVVFFVSMVKNPAPAEISADKIKILSAISGFFIDKIPSGFHFFDKKNEWLFSDEAYELLWKNGNPYFMYYNAQALEYFAEQLLLLIADSGGKPTEDQIENLLDQYKRKLNIPLPGFEEANAKFLAAHEMQLTDIKFSDGPDDKKTLDELVDFICPLTHSIMTKPVKRKGMENTSRYEYAALKQHYIANSGSPLTRRPSNIDDYEVDELLRKRIENVMQQVKTHVQEQKKRSGLESTQVEHTSTDTTPLI